MEDADGADKVDADRRSSRRGGVDRIFLGGRIGGRGERKKTAVPQGRSSRRVAISGGLHALGPVFDVCIADQRPMPLEHPVDVLPTPPDETQPSLDRKSVV